MITSLSYLNRLQADLTALCRTYNEALASTKTLRSAIYFAESTKRIQRNLALPHTFNYTRVIEEREDDKEISDKPAIKKDIRLDFGDMY